MSPSLPCPPDSALLTKTIACRVARFRGRLRSTGARPKVADRMEISASAFVDDHHAGARMTRVFEKACHGFEQIWGRRLMGPRGPMIPGCFDPDLYRSRTRCMRGFQSGLPPANEPLHPPRPSRCGHAQAPEATDLPLARLSEKPRSSGALRPRRPQALSPAPVHRVQSPSWASPPEPTHTPPSPRRSP